MFACGCALIGGIDPALATGPFITTSNDICGILIYFSIAKLILGF
jgi:magnesium transporter